MLGDVKWNNCYFVVSEKPCIFTSTLVNKFNYHFFFSDKGFISSYRIDFSPYVSMHLNKKTYCIGLLQYISQFTWSFGVATNSVMLLASAFETRQNFFFCYQNSVGIDLILSKKFHLNAHRILMWLKTRFVSRLSNITVYIGFGKNKFEFNSLHFCFSTANEDLQW